MVTIVPHFVLYNGITEKASIVLHFANNSTEGISGFMPAILPSHYKQLAFVLILFGFSLSSVQDGHLLNFTFIGEF